MANTKVMEFLSGVEHSTTIEILEEGSKEKSDLIASAKKRGILLKDSRDLGALKTIYLFTDLVNKNKVAVPSAEFQKIFPQIIGKPMNIGHNRKHIVGFYIDYRYVVKGNKAIAYAVFFKGNYPDLWDKVVAFQKKGKLASSFELWASKKVLKADNTYLLGGMEIAGGALIFIEKGQSPAFDDAKVLCVAQKELEKIVDSKYLNSTAKYKCTELITAEGDVPCAKCGRCTNSDKIIAAEGTPKAVEPTPTPMSKIKCNNCNEEFEYNGVGDIKCKKCLAILDRTGNMIYPPQIADFNILCKSCHVNQWLILSNKGNQANLRCLHCSKEYEVTFEIAKPNELLDKLQFVYTGQVDCLQCNKPIYYSGTSAIVDRTLQCAYCGLEFEYNITSSQYKKISKIKEITIAKKIDKEENKVADETKPNEEKKVDSKVEDTKVKCQGCGEVVEYAKESETAKCAKCNVLVDKAGKVVTETEVEKPKVEATKESKTEATTEKKTEPKVDTVKPAEAEVTPEPKAASKTEKVVTKPEVTVPEDAVELPESDVVEIADYDPDNKVEDAALTTEQRNALPDTAFAVVVLVNNDKTGSKRKVRMFPINDAAHVRNALSRLAQAKPRAALQKMGVDVLKVKAKILKRAKKLGMDALIKRYEKAEIEATVRAELTEEFLAAVPKAVVTCLKKKTKAGMKVTQAMKECWSEFRKAKEKAMEDKITFYKENAVEISVRRKDVGKFGEELTDEEILDNDTFATAKAEKENSKIEKAEVVGNKTKDVDHFAGIRKKIDELAFGEIE